MVYSSHSAEFWCVEFRQEESLTEVSLKLFLFGTSGLSMSVEKEFWTQKPCPEFYGIWPLFFSSETALHSGGRDSRLTSPWLTFSYDLITKVRISIDVYFLAPLLVLDYNASRNAKFPNPHDNEPREALPRILHFSVFIQIAFWALSFWSHGVSIVDYAVFCSMLLGIVLENNSHKF